MEVSKPHSCPAGRRKIHGAIIPSRYSLPWQPAPLSTPQLRWSSTLCCATPPLQIVPWPPPRKSCSAPGERCWSPRVSCFRLMDISAQIFLALREFFSPWLNMETCRLPSATCIPASAHLTSQSFCSQFSYGDLQSQEVSSGTSLSPPCPGSFTT